MGEFCTAILVAAGDSSRMQGIDKVMEPVGGVPMLLRTAQAVAASVCIDALVIVTREDLLPRTEAMCSALAKPVTVVSGGMSRAESVLCGLRAVPQETRLVAIHDGARPLVSVSVIDAAIRMAAATGAAAPAVALHDTVKVAHNGIVSYTPDRATLFAVQTPQVFDKGKILAALLDAMAQGLPLTDDCSAAEAAGMQVTLTDGSEENLKITTPTDLILAEAILKRRETQ